MNLIDIFRGRRATQEKDRVDLQTELRVLIRKSIAGKCSNGDADRAADIAAKLGTAPAEIEQLLTVHTEAMELEGRAAGLKESLKAWHAAEAAWEQFSRKHRDECATGTHRPDRIRPPDGFTRGRATS